jgi:CRISPR-associated protein Cmr1
MTNWTTFHLKVVTPLFSGEDPNLVTDSPIRVPSIRGALRFWFRAVAAGHGITDLPTLATAETEVFGSTHSPSPIRLRIDGQPRSQTIAPWADGKPGVQYLLGQGLWKHKVGMQRSFVAAGAKVLLQVRFSGNPQADARFMIALWALLTYGGVGARVRRGFGQLACEKVTGRELPGEWKAEHLVPPNVKQWEVLGNHALTRQTLGYGELGWPAFLRGDPAPGATLPQLPTLSPQWWKGVVRTPINGDVSDALDVIGRQWRDFRAPDRPANRQARNQLSPEWTHVIRGEDTRYRVGALGLPVGYHYPGQPDDESLVVEPYDDQGVLRRASPVWLRPIAFGPNKWRMFTHVFYSELLPDGAVTRLGSDPDRELTIPDPEYSWDAWLDNALRLPPNAYGDS